MALFLQGNRNIITQTTATQYVADSTGETKFDRLKVSKDGVISYSISFEGDRERLSYLVDPATIDLDLNIIHRNSDGVSSILTYSVKIPVRAKTRAYYDSTRNFTDFSMSVNYMSSIQQYLDTQLGMTEFEIAGIKNAKNVNVTSYSKKETFGTIVEGDAVIQGNLQVTGNLVIEVF